MDLLTHEKFQIHHLVKKTKQKQKKNHKQIDKHTYVVRIYIYYIYFVRYLYQSSCIDECIHIMLLIFICYIFLDSFEFK